jgi:hypothetical protein
MRAAACAAVLVTAAGAAQAEEAYPLPPVGAQMTFRLVTTTKFNDKPPVVTGQVYTYTVTAVDGARSKGTIRPTALLFDCAAAAADKECQQALKMPDARREGGMLVIPVPDAVADKLAQEGGFKMQYFLVEERNFPMPALEDPDDLGSAAIGDTPGFIATTSFKCDDTTFKAFFPIGSTPQVTLPCHSVATRSHSRVKNLPDMSHDEPLSAELTYLGTGKLNLPSGEWEVQKIGLKFTPTDVTQPPSEGQYDVSTKLGMIVRVHALIADSKMNFTSETESQLIAYKP